jgi:hypothetical protein
MAQEPPLEISRSEKAAMVGKAKSGFTLLRGFNLIMYTLMGMLCALIMMPESTANLTTQDAVATNVLKRLQTAFDENEKVLELTQEELNLYIEDSIEAEISRGFAGGLTQFEDLKLGLEDGAIDFVMVRRIAGMRSTVSIRLGVELENQRVKVSVPSGYFGSLKVPSGLTKLIMPAFASLKDAYVDEINLMLKATKISVKKGKVVLLYE